jgi:catechol 2,3-dioxygenase-like lactoylglutathione lyase family enzyme
LIHHVTRVVDRAQVEPCGAFYEILGFRRVAVPEGIADRAVWLEAGVADGGAGPGGGDGPHDGGAGPGGGDGPHDGGADGGDSLPAPAGGQQIHLMFGDDPSPEAGHLALVCPDYDATVDALRAAGHDVEPRREHWGSPRAFVRDPSGDLVELMAWPPGGALANVPATPSDSV